MDHKLSVLIQVDVDGAYVRLVVTGCLTEDNQHALYPLVRRARTLISPVAVTVDLTTAEHVEEGALDLLRWALEHDDTAPGIGPMDIVTPDQRLAHRPPPAGIACGGTMGWRAA